MAMVMLLKVAMIMKVTVTTVALTAMMVVLMVMMVMMMATMEFLVIVLSANGPAGARAPNHAAAAVTLAFALC